MKRASDVDNGENISACIVVLKNQHGYFGWEGQRKRCHGATSGVISDLNSSTEILKAVVSSSGDVSQAVRVSSKGLTPIKHELQWRRFRKWSSPISLSLISIVLKALNRLLALAMNS